MAAPHQEMQRVTKEPSQHPAEASLHGTDKHGSLMVNTCCRTLAVTKSVQCQRKTFNENAHIPLGLATAQESPGQAFVLDQGSSWLQARLT